MVLLRHRELLLLFVIVVGLLSLLGTFLSGFLSGMRIIIAVLLRVGSLILIILLLYLAWLYLKRIS